MNKIAERLKRRYESIRAGGRNLAGSLKDRFGKTGIWIPVGLAVACCIICVTLFAVTRNMDTPVSLRSPQYEAQEPPEQFDPGDQPVHTADEGIIVIPAALTDTPPPLAQTASTGDTDAIWEVDKVITYNSFTTREKVKQADGSLGVLSIPKLSLSVNVYQAESEMESMTKGVAHFGYTSVWDGNVGLCAHNVNLDLSDGYFKNIHQLEKGDEVRFSTELGERVYTVSTVKEIADTDWTGLGRTPDNRITMITCITGKPDLRLMVQCVEKR